MCPVFGTVAPGGHARRVLVHAYQDALAHAEGRVTPAGTGANFRDAFAAWRHQMLLAGSFQAAPSMAIVQYGTALWAQTGATVVGGLACLTFNAARYIWLAGLHVAAVLANLARSGARAAAIGLRRKLCRATQQSATPAPGRNERPSTAAFTLQRVTQVGLGAGLFLHDQTGAFAMCAGGAVGALLGAALGFAYYSLLAVMLGPKHPLVAAMVTGLGAAAESARYTRCLMEVQRAAALQFLRPPRQEQAEAANAFADAGAGPPSHSCRGQLEGAPRPASERSRFAAGIALLPLPEQPAAAEGALLAEELARHATAHAANFRRLCGERWGFDPSRPYAAPSPAPAAFGPPEPLGPSAQRLWRQAYTHGLSDLPAANGRPPAASTPNHAADDIAPCLFEARGRHFLDALRQRPVWAYLLALPVGPITQAALGPHRQRLLASTRFEAACDRFAVALDRATRHAATATGCAAEQGEVTQAMQAGLSECVASAKKALKVLAVR